MLNSRMIIVVCLLAATFVSLEQTLLGQTFTVPSMPSPPAFPTEENLLSTDPSLLPAPTRPQATEAPVVTEVRSVVSGSDNIPNEKELVSILKRKLPSADQAIEVKDAPEWFQNMMQRIVRENVPSTYVQDKDWGKTDRRWDGLQVKRKGALKWTTKRKWKEVNHGTWKRYEVTQIDPNKNLQMRIENVRDAGAGKVGFDVRMASKLHVFGRMAKWAKGVQVYNLSADADADVEMRIQCEVGMKLDIGKFPPDVIMMPKVTHADLDVTEFRLQKVSKLNGPIVKQLSGSVHKVLLDKIAEKRERLPQKINRQIEKNQDKMRLSMSDFASSKWESLTEKVEKSSAPKVDADKSQAKSAPIQAPVGQKQVQPRALGKINPPQQAVESKEPKLPSKRVELFDFVPAGG